MVVLTYTFVTSIDPAEQPEGATTRPDPPFPTTPTSTVSTTTFPPLVASFMVTLDIFESQVEGFRGELQRINSRWEARQDDFNTTRTAFLDLKDTIAAWEDEVAQVEGVPPELAEGHVELVIESGDLAPKAEDVVLGLEADDDGSLRRAAVVEFEAAVQEVLDAILGIETAAEELIAGTGSATDEDGTTSSSTTEG